jgi:hypothetical protein
VPALARRATIPGTQLEEWIEPGQHGYCVWVAERTTTGAAITGGFGASCMPATSAGVPEVTIGGGARFAPSQGVARGPLLATGIVPDRVDRIELDTRDGIIIPVPLTDGFFATSLSAGDRLFALSNGQRQLISGVPPARPHGGPILGGHVVAQINLTPARATGGAKPAGIAQIIKQGTNTGIEIAATRVPPLPKRAGYAVWLYSNPANAKLLGFVNPGPNKSGRMTTAGALPSDAGRYSQILITVETRPYPHRPGAILLRGGLRLG